ncbi:phage shock protein C (PspC) family protein [Rhodothalassium salexigens DSM 2132]|uniref:Phage shock protein C (PspC) family protein n=1 Tax=Rhodothalassium salexigens DSM 2132 TaxID=1188247 RepID=A0A4R2PGC8_RHOSA|nr:envelope stress response membrane protein PspC [Rhodothalassium salexigens]MBB4211659.1 phage shock protein C [Rhodothalassium salexigens DSM 2132]MBK1640035.1 envelope stress response membrane protein PspC [Rhodothalassium salexigens DSM 2132]TCP34409.1 phage shock protein C (PspC) family protein [Rhodothalassium salexigens DSM 2132]
MTRYSRNKLYKDPREGTVMGVCAGLSDYLGVKVGVVRLLTVICALLWFIPVVPLYFGLGFLLDERPRDLYRDEGDAEFWRTARNRPDVTKAELKRRFRDVDRRMQRLESFLTSKKYRLERELRDLER